jgi:peptidoglycan/xylan/chitin deacetylase (PgdA/CDA1 family)
MRIFRLPKIVQPFFPSIICSFPLKSNYIVLTFDDGPDEVCTPQILELLQKENVSASFFVLGEKAQRQFALLKAIRQNGHTIGLHGYCHESLLFRSNKFIFDQLTLGKQIIEDLLGEPVKYIRPPYGKFSPRFSKICKQLNLQIIMWNLMSYDFDLGFSDEWILKLMDTKASSGDIIVFHDGHKNSQRTVNILDSIIEILKKKNFLFEAIENR